MQNDGMNLQSPAQPSQSGQGCLGEITWLGMGLTLPLTCKNFYRRVAGRRLLSAFLVFFVFALILTVLTTITFSNTLAEGQQGIQRAFDDGTFPTITIQDGIATVDAPQPFYLADQGGDLIVLDTTGQVTDIDRDRYSQGMVLTRTDLIVLNNGRLQTVSLADLQSAFNQNPLVLDRTNSVNLWNDFSKVLVIVAFFAVAMWNMLLRLGYLALLALLVWPIARLFNPKVGYAVVFGIGAYVLIPAMILRYLIVRSTGSGFFMLQTLLFVPLWLVGLLWALRQPSDAAPIRPWEVLVPLPLLALIVIDKLIPIQNGDIILWGALALTVLAAVAVVRLWPAEDHQSPPPTIEPLP